MPMFMPLVGARFHCNVIHNFTQAAMVVGAMRCIAGAGSRTLAGANVF
jgi:hypothetical protein